MKQGRGAAKGLNSEYLFHLDGLCGKGRTKLASEMNKLAVKEKEGCGKGR
jgi:hypothetical protein